MKRIALIAAGLVLASLAACNSPKATNTASPGTVSGATCDKSKCPAECAKDKAACTETNAASPGAVNGEKAGCCKAGAAASPGAVNGEKSGCCKAGAAASPGAVSETKSGCCKSGAGCTKAPTTN